MTRADTGTTVVHLPQGGAGNQLALPWGSATSEHGAQPNLRWVAVPSETVAGDLCSGRTTTTNRRAALAEVAKELLRRPEIRRYGAGRGVWVVGLFDESDQRMRLPISGRLIIRIMGYGDHLRAACFPGPVIYAKDV